MQAMPAGLQGLVVVLTVAAAKPSTSSESDGRRPGGENDRVEAVEHAAMSGGHPAPILHAAIARSGMTRWLVRSRSENSALQLTVADPFEVLPFCFIEQHRS